MTDLSLQQLHSYKYYAFRSGVASQTVKVLAAKPNSEFDPATHGGSFRTARWAVTIPLTQLIT